MGNKSNKYLGADIVWDLEVLKQMQRSLKNSI
jgi:hypothetical protein